MSIIKFFVKSIDEWRERFHIAKFKKNVRLFLVSSSYGSKKHYCQLAIQEMFLIDPNLITTLMTIEENEGIWLNIGIDDKVREIMLVMFQMPDSNIQEYILSLLALLEHLGVARWSGSDNIELTSLGHYLAATYMNM